MKSTLTYFFLGLFHFCLLLFLVDLCLDRSHSEGAFGFLVWDAVHYSRIAEQGYDLSSVAFFPGFPFFWKLTMLSAKGISALNLLLFLGAASFLSAFRNIPKSIFLLFLTIPSVLFMCLPYAEALVFLFSVLFLFFLVRRNILYASLALLVLSFFKPTVGVFIPVVLISELLFFRDDKDRFKRLFAFCVAVFAGTISVLLIQFWYVGDFFAFFKAQSQWGNHPGFPKFPLSTWNQSQVIWIDAAAFVFGGISVIILFKLFIDRTKIQAENRVELVYSALFIAGSCGYVLFFRDGMLFSLNRFVFAVPFALVILNSFRSQISIPFRKYMYLLLALLVVSLVFGSYMHIQSLMKYALWSIGLIAFYHVVKTQGYNSNANLIDRILYVIVYLLMLTIQVGFGISLTHGGWLA